MGRLTLSAALFVGAVVLYAPSRAEKPTTLPDPVAVTIPDLVFTPTSRDIKDYWEYYYFHKVGVPFDKALADWSECLSYSSDLDAAPPDFKFVPIGTPGPAERPNTQISYLVNYGIVGTVVGVGIFSVVSASVNHGVERANTRRCMGAKGYHRYGLSRTIWKQLNKGTDQEILVRFAKIASGAVPNAMEIEP